MQITDEQLFDMITSMKSELSTTREELVATREAMHRYNGLREDLAAVVQRVTAIEQQRMDRASFGKAVVDWGSWIVAICAVGVSVWSSMKK